ncbi:MAG TPA: hypothetical protein VFK56_12790, partial [Mycobacterium sp.]|nr:hypothetical protein [Mycobacterium sp.]
MGAPRDMKAVVDLKNTDIDTYIAGVAGRVDRRPMLTHTSRLQQWRDAFLAIANQGRAAWCRFSVVQSEPSLGPNIG